MLIPFAFEPFRTWLAAIALVGLVSASGACRLIPTIAVHDYMAEFWKKVLPNLTVHDTVTLRTGASFAVPIRKGSPRLAAELNTFIAKSGLGTAFGNVIEKRYLVSTKFVKNAASEAEQKKFLALTDYFKKYSDQYQLDYLLMAAQGYQESQLNQDAKSQVGAIGAMQIMPATGRDVKVGDITQTEAWRMLKAVPLRRLLPIALLLAIVAGVRPWSQGLPAHPRLLFDRAELSSIQARSTSAKLAPIRDRLLARATALLTAPPLLVSTTGRGEADPPGTLKGLDAARRLQGRVATFAMAFLLNGDRRFRDAAVAQLDFAIANWPIWVDTAHAPPYDLMTGEMSLTFGLAYDWLHASLTVAERTRLREGVERRALRPYLEATSGAKPMWWYSADHNWNTVTNGGATVLALGLGGDSALSDHVLRLSVPGMAPYWNNLGDDGGWEEGTGYWTYGHRYAFMAADALRRAGWDEGAQYLAREGARNTGSFPLVFNPGTRLSASFSDSAGRAADPIFYFLGREYENPDYAWFQDRVALRSATSEGWPDEALALVWREVDASWLPESRAAFRPLIPASASFPSIGWAMLASEQPDPALFLAFKSGSTGANHSHLDLNHVTVGMGDNMVLIDLGSRAYPANYFSSARAGYYEISTAGHNSVLVGGKGQVFNRDGALRGPLEGAGYTAYTGVADGSYEVSTPRARRTVVFVDRRYYVLLDEVAPATTQPIELRFHSYGTIAPRPQRGGWTVTQADSALDVVPADSSLLAGTVESPSGWIRAVNLLRLASPQPMRSLTLATAIIPRTRGVATYPQVSQEDRGSELRVRVDGDQVVFRQTADGYVISSVAKGQSLRP